MRMIRSYFSCPYCTSTTTPTMVDGCCEEPWIISRGRRRGVTSNSNLLSHFHSDVSGWWWWWWYSFPLRPAPSPIPLLPFSSSAAQNYYLLLLLAILTAITLPLRRFRMVTMIFLFSHPSFLYSSSSAYHTHQQQQQRSVSGNRKVDDDNSWCVWW